MAFNERAKTIALAIVKVFETGKPLGNYSAVAVLNDGAGISYGMSQFTHKSKSLVAVLGRFILLGGVLPESVLNALPAFKKPTASNILSTSQSRSVKDRLRDLGKDPRMQQAQREIASELYLQPAIKACEGSGFVRPLSLAVIYDSFIHGSYARIRDRVPPGLNERQWITRYVQERNKWLRSIARLKVTAYRTKFFTDQIVGENWGLELPIVVHGRKITEEILFPERSASSPDLSDSKDLSSFEIEIEEVSTPEPPAASPGAGLDLDKAGEMVQQQIPKITTGIRWLGTLGLGGIASTTLAAFNGLPPWALFTLGVLTALLLIGLFLLFRRYYLGIYNMVGQVMEINSRPELNHIQLVSRKDLKDE